ncbi:MAG: T9SS type A sorting domain-containing protein, partial [Ignavibacteriaceae bacterium]
VPGFGTTTEQHSYSYMDANLSSGTYLYRLKQIDFDGTFEYSNEIEIEVYVPASFSLEQNYPNPFNPSTKITFSLAVDSKVSLKIFDVLGQEVASLINQDLSAGVHNFNFNAAGIYSGVYFYRIEATGVNGTEFVNVKKMILVK